MVENQQVDSLPAAARVPPALQKPLCIDLFCGLGGWTEGFLIEGYRVVGFDIQRHGYWAPELTNEAGDGQKVPGFRFDGSGRSFQTASVNLASDQPRTKFVSYPAQIVLQDILTVHGSQFRDAAVIVASPPCQNYSYLAMPWSRSVDWVRPDGDGWEVLNSAAAKEMREKWEREGPDNRLFDACFRIQREAVEARMEDCSICGDLLDARSVFACDCCYIPLIVENVRGAQPWVGRSAWNYGSFHLWGDVPALMPITFKQPAKVPSESGRRTDVGNGAGFTSRDCGVEAKSAKENGGWFNDYKGEHCVGVSRTGSKSSARKLASAQIAKIPLPLSQHIAKVYYPQIYQGAGLRAAGGKS